MNKETILKKAIEKAVKNGYDDGAGFKYDFATYHNVYESVIFSHDFAKAFWGEERSCTYNINRGWKYHLKQMVLEEDPIKYLERFL